MKILKSIVVLIATIVVPLTFVLFISVSVAAGSSLDQEPSEEEIAARRPKSLEQLCEAADFIIVAEIRTCRDLGKPIQADEASPARFARLTVAHEVDLYGDLKERAQQEAESAGRVLPDDWTITSLFLDAEGSFERLTEGKKCVLFLSEMKAGAMAGTVPLRINWIEAAGDDLLESARKFATDR